MNKAQTEEVRPCDWIAIEDWVLSQYDATLKNGAEAVCKVAPPADAWDDLRFESDVRRTDARK
jgi:hypothetical protein